LKNISELTNDQLIMFYGRPSEWRKKTILKLLHNKIGLVDKVFFIDLTYSLSPDDFLGWKLEELRKIFIVSLSDKELLLFIDYLANIKNITEKIIVVLHPFYTQGGLKINGKEIDPLYVFFGLKSTCLNNQNVVVWLIIDTNVIDTEKLPMFSIIKDEVKTIIGIIKIDNQISLKASINNKLYSYVFSL